MARSSPSPPLLGASPAGRRIAALLGKNNGEAPTPFSFVQLSDTHVGDVELTLREFSGTVGIQQLLKEGVSL